MTEKSDKLQICGQQRRSILQKFSGQLKQWQLNMPVVDPLIMDFGQGDYDKVGLIEYWIANELEAGYCGKYLFLFAHQQCPFHSHRQKHETFFVVKGKVKMVIDEKEVILGQGQALSTPPGKGHSLTGIVNSLILELSTPCLVDDNQFREPKIDEWLRNNLR